MNATETEQVLRRTYAETAEQWDATWPTGTTDPWIRVAAGVRHQKRRRVVAGAAGVAVLALAGVALVVTPPGDTRGAPAASQPQELVEWPLNDGAPRGELARDADFAAGLAQRWVDEVATEGGGTTRVDGLDVVFAGDVGPHRIAVVVVRSRSESGDPVNVHGWFGGAAGAEPADMALRDQLPVTNESWPLMATQYLDESGDSRMFAVVPRGGEVTVSSDVSIRSDGNAAREWTSIDVPDDGVLDVPLSGIRGWAVLRLESAPGYPGGAPVAEQAVFGPGPLLPSDEDPVVLNEAEVSAALAGARGTGRDSVTYPNMVDDAVGFPNNEMHTEAGDAPPQALWVGEDPSGSPAVSTVVTTGRPGQGQLLRWAVDPVDGAVGPSVLWMGLYPSGDLSQQLLTWRAPSADPTQDGRELIGWLAPRDSADVEVYVNGSPLEVSNVDGHGWVEVEAGAEVMIAVLDGQGRTVQEAEPRPMADTGDRWFWLLPGEDPGAPDPVFHN